MTAPHEPPNGDASHPRPGMGERPRRGAGERSAPPAFAEPDPDTDDPEFAPEHDSVMVDDDPVDEPAESDARHA